MKTTVSRYWRSLPSWSPERVIAHAANRRKRGKKPSMGFWGEHNPVKALKKARLKIDDTKRSAVEWRERLRSRGTLTESEIEELIGFDFFRGADTVEEQVRRYYLMLKRDNGSDADCVQRMLAETSRILEQPCTLESIKALCIELRKYVSGFLIRYEGKCYAVTGGSFRQV